MTDVEIIEEVLTSEGPGDPAKGYLTPGDKGGRTNWGISEKAHPEEWADGKVPDKERARAIYAAIYVAPWSEVADPNLRAQLVDWSVLHGVERTGRWLGRMLFTSVSYIPKDRVKAVSIARLNQMDGYSRYLNNALVAFRLKMIDDISDADLKQKKFEEGWEGRALRFLL